MSMNTALETHSLKSNILPKGIEFAPVFSFKEKVQLKSPVIIHGLPEEEAMISMSFQSSLLIKASFDP